jgi:hypothetical protein
MIQMTNDQGQMTKEIPTANAQTSVFGIGRWGLDATRCPARCEIGAMHLLDAQLLSAIAAFEPWSLGFLWVMVIGHRSLTIPS